MNFLQDFLANISWEEIFRNGLRILLILGVTWVASVVIKKLLHRLEIHLIKKSEVDGEPQIESKKRIETLISLLRQASLIALWLTVCLMILREFGVEIAPIIASAGIVGLAVGFGAQNLVRDIISGFFIILENQIRVGDVAIINGTGGLVEDINFRTTILRDLAGNVHVFPNGSINTLANMTKEWSANVFEVGVAYKENTDQVTEVLVEIGKQLKADEKFGPLMLAEPEIFGVDKLDDSAVVIKGRIKTLPSQQWAVGREFLRRVKLAFDERNIEIPFPHSTINFGEASKPFDLQILERIKENPS